MSQKKFQKDIISRNGDSPLALYQWGNKPTNKLTDVQEIQNYLKVVYKHPRMSSKNSSNINMLADILWPVYSLASIIFINILSLYVGEKPTIFSQPGCIPVAGSIPLDLVRWYHTRPNNWLIWWLWPAIDI